MNDPGMYLTLTLYIKTQGVCIAVLKTMMNQASDSKKAAKFGELHELERRHEQLKERLHKLDREGPGIRQDVNAERSLLAENIQGGLDSLMFSTEAHCAADEDRKSGRKS